MKKKVIDRSVVVNHNVRIFNRQEVLQQREQALSYLQLGIDLLTELSSADRKLAWVIEDSLRVGREDLQQNELPQSETPLSRCQVIRFPLTSPS